MHNSKSLLVYFFLLFCFVWLASIPYILTKPQLTSHLRPLADHWLTNHKQALSATQGCLTSTVFIFIFIFSCLSANNTAYKGSWRACDDTVGVSPVDLSYTENVFLLYFLLKIFDFH